METFLSSTIKNHHTRLPSTVCSPTFFKISSSVFDISKKRHEESKCWQNDQSWLHCPFKSVLSRQRRAAVTHPLTSFSFSSSTQVRICVARMEDTSSSWMSWVEAITKQLRLAWRTERSCCLCFRSDTNTQWRVTAPYWWRTPWWCPTPCGWSELFLHEIPDRLRSAGARRDHNITNTRLRQERNRLNVFTAKNHSLT